MARHRNGQTINVKVQRKKIIIALEKALTKLDTDYKNQDKLEKQYKLVYAKWVQMVYAKIKSTKPVDVDCRYHITVTFEKPNNLPKEPERNFKQIPDWEYKDSKEEIENAIRLLNMCEDEYVNTATYGAISKYL